MIISYSLRRLCHGLLACMQPEPGRYDLSCATDWPLLVARLLFLVVYSILALNILSVHVLIVALIEHRPGALLHMKAPVLWFIVMHMGFNLYETLITLMCAAREKVCCFGVLFPFNETEVMASPQRQPRWLLTTAEGVSLIKKMSVCLLLSFWLVFANDKTQDVVAIFMPGTHGNYLFENIIMLLFLDQLVYDAICGVIQTVGLGSTCDESSCAVFVRYFLHCRYRTMEVYGWHVNELPTPNGVGIHKTPHSPRPVRRGSLQVLPAVAGSKDGQAGLLIASKTCHDLQVLELLQLELGPPPLSRAEMGSNCSWQSGQVKTL